MRRSFSVVIWFASILILAAATGALAQVDPKALREQHVAAIARGDVAGALALYTEDAVINGGGGGALCDGPLYGQGSDLEGT